MNILIASSEAVPFAKTGGLADVCGALPVELARLGHEVAVVLPAYRQALEQTSDLDTTGGEFAVTLGGKQVTGTLLRSTLPDSDVPVYLVQQDAYFDREQLYGARGQDYRDNCERFTFFCRAVMAAIDQLDLPVDLLHCNDWQTGLIPAYIATATTPQPERPPATLLTIHNMAYQGQFWHWDMLLTGLDWKYFNWRQMEFHGKLNFLKTGIVFADAINTVSPTYAREIQSAPLGCGLEAVLQYRGDSLSGIINGVDYDIWNPATDASLVQPYDHSSWQKGKAACKADLQQALGLAPDPHPPLLGLVGRLAEQKGWTLVLEVMQRWAEQHAAQWVVLGTGDQQYERQLTELATAHPGKIAARLDFDEGLAHRIEAGSDIFLMPSRYEPCGLNQLYSLKYGTLPVVHDTGGLSDTINDAVPDNLQAGTANGFKFAGYDVEPFEAALLRACDMFLDQKETWDRMVTGAMQSDWSWRRSAENYVALYDRTVRGKQ